MLMLWYRNMRDHDLLFQPLSCIPRILHMGDWVINIHGASLPRSR